jgi:hypothetical protein
MYYKIYGFASSDDKTESTKKLYVLLNRIYVVTPLFQLNRCCKLLKIFDAIFFIPVL